ncbi:MAG: YdcF family protein [Parcubacteria group bacterium]
MIWQHLESFALKNKKAKIRRVLTAMRITAVIVVFLVTLTPLNDWLTFPLVTSETPRNADIIIVLGSGLARDGSLNKNGKEQVIQASSFLRSGFAHTLLMSGGLVKKVSFYESEQMANYAVGLGIPFESVVIEKTSTSTEENAHYTKIMMQENSWQSALLVTSRYHSKRACGVFRKHGMVVSCVITDSDLVSRISPVDRLNEFRSIIREYGATVYYKLKGYI